MSHILKAAAGIAIGTVALGGSVTIIPLTPILILAGIIGGTVVAVSSISSPKGRDSKTKAIAKIQTSKGGDKFYIQSQAGDYCSAELDSDCRLTCNRKIVQEWEYFEMLKTDDGRFAFQASNKKFVSADRNKDGLLIADRNQIEDWELFTMEERDDSFVTFKASNGKYVSRRQDDKTLLKATATSAGNSELFRIMIKKDEIAMKDPITIIKPFKIDDIISIKIDIHNHEQLATDEMKTKYGSLAGKIMGKTAWLLFQKKVKKIVNSMVEEPITEELASIEERVIAELPAIIEERIKKEFDKKNVKATIIVSVK